MSFIPLSPCCLTGGRLTGEPRGIMQPAQGAQGPTPEGDAEAAGQNSGRTRTVARYATRPSQGVVDDTAALILYTDAFGLSITNPKIIADAFADQLKLNVFVPEYIPDPPPAAVFNSVAPIYPEQHANRSWFTSIRLFLGVIPKVYPWLPMLLFPKKQVPLAQQALEDVVNEGYIKIGLVGYCRGGAMVEYLLSTATSSPLASAVVGGVMCHPSPERQTYAGIAKPTIWHLADHDQMFGAKEIEHLKTVFEAKKADGVWSEIHVHPDTVHGFAARPTLEHEPTEVAFQKANESAIVFFRKHLLGKGAGDE